MFLKFFLLGEKTKPYPNIQWPGAQPASSGPGFGLGVKTGPCADRLVGQHYIHMSNISRWANWSIYFSIFQRFPIICTTSLGNFLQLALDYESSYSPNQVVKGTTSNYYTLPFQSLHLFFSSNCSGN